MPGKSLGLDISNEAVTAVMVRKEFRGYRIIGCGYAGIQKNGGLPHALHALSERMDLVADTCIAAIPAEKASYRNIQFPFKDINKIRQTLPFEIEPMLPFAIQEMVVDFIPTDRSKQGEVLAACIKKESLSEYLKCLREQGLDPGILDIRGISTVSWLLKQEGAPESGMILEMETERSTMFLFNKGRIALIRVLLPEQNQKVWSGGGEGETDKSIVSLCRELQNTIHAFEWCRNDPVRPEKVFLTGPGALDPETTDLITRLLGIPAEPLDLSMNGTLSMAEHATSCWSPALMNGALSLALMGRKRDHGFNFRRDEFAVKKEFPGARRELRRAALFMAIIISLLTCDMVVDYHFLRQRYRSLDREITRVFKETLPEVRRIVDPVQQMRVRIMEMEKSSLLKPRSGATVGVLNLLKEISRRIPPSLEVQVTQMVIDPDTVRITGKTDTFNTVDSIKTALDGSQLFASVTISSANLTREGNKVRFEMKLQRPKQGI